MIWLTLRQFRTQAAVVFGAVVVFAVALAVTGPGLAHRYTEGGDFLGRLSGADTALYLLGVLAVLALPFVVGLFWGAPLLTRELDAGTHRLVWTQTTRARWTAAKLGLTGLAAMAAAGLLSLAVTWWAGPIDAAIGAHGGPPAPGLLVFPRMSREVFDARGIVPLGYAAFAFVLGVAIGTLVRRTLPAMAILLAAFAVTQIVMSMAVRPHLMAPERVTTTITSKNLMFIGDSGLTVVPDEPGAWISAQHTVDAAGRTVRPPSWVLNCPAESRSGSEDCFARLARLGYRQVVSYQPASRFWAFQRDETAIYLGLALITAGFCAWRIRRLS